MLVPHVSYDGVTAWVAEQGAPESGSQIAQGTISCVPEWPTVRTPEM